MLMELTALSLSALMSLMSATAENQKIATYELPAVAGLWQIQLEKPIDNACYERYNFGRDGKLTTTSGAERTFGDYRLQYVDGFELPVLAMHTKFDNNEVDCSGNQVDQSKESLAVFVKLDSRHNPKTMAWCNDPMGQDCPSNLHKILP